jgi:hypothetical protein
MHDDLLCRKPGAALLCVTKSRCDYRCTSDDSDAEEIFSPHDFALLVSNKS